MPGGFVSADDADAECNRPRSPKPGVMAQPPTAVIRVVLDNHSAHISRETMAYLATRPGRFEYVHTPKHGSWLNLIECAFSKMARTFLRHIRVDGHPPNDRVPDRICSV